MFIFKNDNFPKEKFMEIFSFKKKKKILIIAFITIILNEKTKDRNF